MLRVGLILSYWRRLWLGKGVVRHESIARSDGDVRELDETMDRLVAGRNRKRAEPFIWKMRL